ncbi:carbohydrate esterase family 1 protein [Thozetella sp. PMI_491]|nr:carbohydrate esterase family 1 protein [Thozetella sp. PMI_491]
MAPSQPMKRAENALQQVTDFGANESGTKMYIYIPSTLAKNPPIIVAIHYCTGTAEAYFTGSPYAQLADEKGFIVIYPESPYSGTCWDVSSQAALTHGGGGDSNSIANMVTYALAQYKGDPSKVFVTGSSSGAMMTNVLAATYPNMFAAGIVYSGVAAGCFYSQTGGVDQWNSSCSTGAVVASQETWAQIVHDMDPGYTGARPKMQIYHGSADTVLLPPNYNETMKEWAGVLGYDSTKPDTVEVNVPLDGYTTYTWGGGRLIGVYAKGVGHTVPIRGSDDMKFFGL